MSDVTFIVDCPHCRAKVAALESGRALRQGFDDDAGEPFGEEVHIGACPRCRTILVGQATQIGFRDTDGDDNVWSDIVRVFPKPAKVFSSWRIPRVVTDSLLDADRSLQANACIAACVMFGRALEAMCQHVLVEAELDKKRIPGIPPPPPVPSAQSPTKKKRNLTLHEGIEALRKTGVIDNRLYDWSQQLRAFRNLAAHAQEDVIIAREDAEDLQTFVYAIVEYVYDLADRYDEFKARLEKKIAAP